MYKVFNGGTIVRTTDGAFVPKDTANTDYKAYLDWIAAGNTPDPADSPALLKQDTGHFDGGAHTTGATSAEVFRQTVPTNSQFNVNMVASGVALDNGAQRTLWVVAVVQRRTNGATVVGQTAYGNIASAVGNPVAATAFVLAASGNDIVITVTGLANREIDWSLAGTYVRIRPTGL
jgi:hypothetical protein